MFFLNKKRDDFIGEAEITLEGLVRDEETIKWIKLENIAHGEIQLGIKPITFGECLFIIIILL